MYAMVQYYFDGPVIPVMVKPHGSSKSSKPFFRTATTVKKECKELAKEHTPSQTIMIMTAQQGGEVHIQGAGSVARDEMQIKNFRRRSITKEDNALHAIMLECKIAQGKADAFVRDVKAAPEPMAVCYADWQLSDLERFCTNSAEFTILSVDTTYNLGDFFVTPISYRHLLLEDIRSGEPPVILGPVLVHQQMKFASFNYFASVLVDGNKKLRNIRAFGTDGDTNLSDALSHNFPFALALRCFIHFERNIREKLRDYGIPPKVADEFIYDIMGNRQGSTYQEGLVDCVTVQDFNKKLLMLESIWNEREKQFCGTGGPRFYKYFKQYKADVVSGNMLKGVHEAAGLGSPPSIFTTNMSESLNKVIKQHVKYKASQWPKFNDSLRTLVSAKQEEVIRAISGRGQYRLRNQYAHLQVSQLEWQRKRPDQRKKLIRQLDQCSLLNEQVSIPSVSQQSTSNTQSDEGCSQPAAEDSPSLSISHVDSGITNLHHSVLKPMWEKAIKLLTTQRGLQPAASSDASAWSVQLFTSAVLHFVTSKADGQYMCDAQCPQWASIKICSHTVAVAEKNGQLLKFLKWYSSTHQKTNITAIGMLNMPKGRGQKGSVAKRKRTRSKASEPEIVTSRPSLQTVSTISTSLVPAPYYSSRCASGASYNTSVYSQSSPVCTSQSQPVNPNPFYLKFITGNIRVCQGCKGSLRAADFSLPDPPYDLCVAHAEKRPYRDNSGNLVTPTTYKPSHYHLAFTCIQAVEPAFFPNCLQIPNDIQNELTPEHKSFVWVQMGLLV